MTMTIERAISRVSDGKLIEVFTLGELYVSDFIDADSPPPVKVPLTLALDKKSSLLQLKQTAPFDKMYGNYWYRSGMNRTMTEELKGVALKAASLVNCSEGDVVLDIGCNDGTLLSFYPRELFRVGFDPARNLREYAEKHANLIVTDYFTAEGYFNKLEKKAKIITSIAIFYDMEDPHKFTADLEAVLDADGLWIIQMSYLPLMLKQLAFDNICHEHLEYYSLSSFNYVIKQHGLKIVDVELNDINGGSFRIYVRKNNADDNLFATAPYRDIAEYRISSIFEYEKILNLNDSGTYTSWFKKVLELKEKTVSFIKSEKSKGKTIWGYGASTKGNTLLQFFDLDNTLIDAIAERNPMKYGKRTVGTNIPITSEAEMRKAQPDYLLMLPWHFVSEFKLREKEYLLAGGKFIVPCPKFGIITSHSG
jgi:2-polyprenyl-3-methyl-5-hydroxy-6-metoxy-1,4-benzoquinol methylase